MISDFILSICLKEWSVSPYFSNRDDLVVWECRSGHWSTISNLLYNILNKSNLAWKPIFLKIWKLPLIVTLFQSIMHTFLIYDLSTISLDFDWAELWYHMGKLINLHETEEPRILALVGTPILLICFEEILEEIMHSF